METIKIIDEKTIERNGIKYVPEKAEETKFKVGQWVVFLPEKAKDMHLYTDFWNAPHIMRILKITNADNYLHFDENQDPYNNGDKSSNVCDCFRPATKEEIEAHLRKICDEKGYKKGMKVKDANDGLVSVITENEPEEYRPEYDSLVIRSRAKDHDYRVTNLYYNGKFAEILPDLKKKPETREEFEAFLDDYTIAVPTFEPRNKFLNLYKW